MTVPIGKRQGRKYAFQCLYLLVIDGNGEPGMQATFAAVSRRINIQHAEPFGEKEGQDVRGCDESCIANCFKRVTQNSVGLCAHAEI